MHIRLANEMIAAIEDSGAAFKREKKCISKQKLIKLFRILDFLDF